MSYYTLKTSLPRGLVECIEPPMVFSGQLCFSSHLVPLLLPMFVTKHVTGQCRYLILVEPCWIKASWLWTVLGMLDDVPCCAPWWGILSRIVWLTGHKGDYITAFKPMAVQKCTCLEGFSLVFWLVAGTTCMSTTSLIVLLKRIDR